MDRVGTWVGVGTMTSGVAVVARRRPQRLLSLPRGYRTTSATSARNIVRA